MTTEPVRVLVAEDHPMFREGLVTAFETTDGVELVAAVETGEEAVELAGAQQPDVVVMDLQLPGMNGVEATRGIVTASPHIAVLVLTMYDDDDLVFSAMRAGARGYLLKDARSDDIVRAVQGVARGEAIFGPTVATRLIDFFASPRRQGPEPFPQLTDREREVLDLIAQGLGNQAIANRLYVSPKTVRNHASNIFTKLQVMDRAEAIVRARDAGMGRDAAGSLD